ncbi:MAG TPA: aconitase/3-isopropylmalate dehydratase large subunit family protein [Gemmatimonadaceae bacterium]|jgi:3-isopropylmalate/(R)-2-methylmalate dehydratase large subunit|nr:aconitase/3-isopropylmalate dehydratase large subunit family protein [Gemmatimonadaceae bacterium]
MAEKILSDKSDEDARAGDIVVCDADLVIGTDASAPMAIAYFEKMGGTRVRHPDRVVFALDHYDPTTSPGTAKYHDLVRRFAAAHGVRLYERGEGISHQLAVERGEVRPGQLVLGADSHTVTCGALNLFATGIGSSDLAAAMITGQIWLRVPETIRITLTGRRSPSATAKDVALAIVSRLGAEGANYQAVEISGSGVAAFALDERLLLSNLLVESGAKAAMFAADAEVETHLAAHGITSYTTVSADDDAVYSREVDVDLATLSPIVALPHSPAHATPIDSAAGTPIHMVFLGTCTGGRVRDYHDAVAVIERGGGKLAPGVQLVVTPASREIEQRLMADGTMAKLASMGAVITAPGCGACCGTSGVIPGDGFNVLSTANRNFKARMGNATASIYLASAAACAAAAVTGVITDPADIAAEADHGMDHREQ